MEDTYNSLKLCEWIKKIRIKMGLRQEDIAQVIGCNRSSYAKMEVGNHRYSPLTHLDEILTIFGEFANESPPYKFNDYTNQRLLLYICMFGVPFATVREVFGVHQTTLHDWLWKSEKKYLLQYKAEIDELFPEKDKLSKILEVNIIDKKTLCIICVDGNRIFIKYIPEHPKHNYDKLRCFFEE